MIRLKPITSPTMARRWFPTVLTLLWLGCPLRSEEPQKPARLEGGFIQIQGWMKNLTPQDWQQELRAMRQAGMNLVIIQYVAYNQHSFLPARTGDPDPVGTILSIADETNMKVFVGTKADDLWWEWDRAYLTKALIERKKLVEEINQRYGQHQSFAGWYFTEECSGGLEPAQVRQLRAYFSALSGHCKTLRNQAVAFAPFFSEITPIESLRTIYTELLDGAGIDIMMVQDGVGARGWDANLVKWVVPAFAMFAEVCQKRQVTLWCDLESFKQAPPGGKSGFVPAEPERIQRQLAAVAPYVEKVVTFDFFHYMSPYRGEPQKRLYDGYLQAVRETNPGQRPSY